MKKLLALLLALVLASQLVTPVLAETLPEDTTAPTVELEEPTPMPVTEPPVPVTEAPTEPATETPTTEATEAPETIPAETTPATSPPAATEVPEETDPTEETEPTEPTEATEATDPGDAQEPSAGEKTGEEDSLEGYYIAPEGAKLTDAPALENMAAFTGKDKVKKGVHTASFTGLIPGLCYTFSASRSPGQPGKGGPEVHPHGLCRCQRKYQH